MKCRNDGQKPWSYRRKVVNFTLLFCGAVVAYSLYNTDLEPTVAISAIGSAATLATGVIGAYIFGATWDDKGKKNGETD